MCFFGAVLVVVGAVFFAVPSAAAAVAAIVAVLLVYDHTFPATLSAVVESAAASWSLP